MKLARIFAVVAIGGLGAAVVIPALQSTRPEAADALTVYEQSHAGAQAFTVDSAVRIDLAARSAFSATTPGEIATIEAEEQAAKTAAAAAASRLSAPAVAAVDLSQLAPAGSTVWPVHGATIGDGFLDRGGSHDGVDMLAPAMTPIYAIADGVVTVSSESYYGFGVAVEITHQYGANSVLSSYAHMTYGTRQVEAGATVRAGQLIGYVGTTGNSTANHLHFEVQINGSLVDPMGFLAANAG